jgi:hypothetical protein
MSGDLTWSEAMALATMLVAMSVACESDADKDRPRSTDSGVSPDEEEDSVDTDPQGDSGFTVPNGVETVVDMAELCAEEVGYFPGGINCLSDAVLLPVTRNDAEVSAHTEDQTCDKPALLPLESDDGQCVPYTRVGRVKGVDAEGNIRPETDWVFVCRRHHIVENPRDPDFSDIAMIAANSETGATCFFQAFPKPKEIDENSGGELGGPVRIAPPHERPADTPPGQFTAEEFWSHPKDAAAITCVTCHDSDPWIHTPYINQAWWTNPVTLEEELVVPSGADRSRPYTILGTSHFDKWPVPRAISPEGNGCVECHRMGTSRTCGQLVAQAVGSVDTSHVSSTYSRFPLAQWMPPNSTEGLDHEGWNALYLDDSREIVDCCADLTQPHCNLEVIGSINGRTIELDEE